MSSAPATVRETGNLRPCLCVFMNIFLHTLLPQLRLEVERSLAASVPPYFRTFYICFLSLKKKSQRGEAKLKFRIQFWEVHATQAHAEKHTRFFRSLWDCYATDQSFMRGVWRTVPGQKYLGEECRKLLQQVGFQRWLRVRHQKNKLVKETAPPLRAACSLRFYDEGACWYMGWGVRES